AKDVSKEKPEVLQRLQQLWLLEAAKYNVLPLDDRFAERGNSEIAGRPDLIKGNRQIVYGGLTRVPALAMVNMANKSFAGYRRSRRSGDGCGRRHRRCRRRDGRLEPLCKGWEAEV